MVEANSWIEIGRKALLSNLNAFRAVMTPSCALLVVVKANAYGHGLDVVARAAADEADWLGVNSLDEALDIEKLDLDRPILILGHTPQERLPEVARHGFRQVVFGIETAMGLSEAAKRVGRKVPIHIKVETGTYRLGVALSNLEPLLDEIAGLEGLDVEGIYTHFANIEDTLDPSFAELQLERFQEACRRAGKKIRPRMVHTAATAGMLLYPQTHFSMVRVGIGTYGIWPSRETRIAARERGREIQLAPVMTWKTRVAQIKPVAAGEYVGYGLTFQASRGMRLAVIPVGYYEGYDRRLSNSGRALVRGRSVPVVGRVAMNMMMLDVTEVSASEGDEVVLLGRQGEAEIPVEEISEKAGTISYEIVSRIHSGLPRILV
jgi:alanine racemase